MDDIVALKVTDKNCGQAAFITWGRIFGAVDSQSLIKVVSKHLHHFGILQPEELELCYCLQDVKDFPNFYEALIYFAQRPIRFGVRSYPAWAKERKQAMLKGNEIYFLAFLDRYGHRPGGGYITRGTYKS